MPMSISFATAKPYGYRPSPKFSSASGAGKPTLIKELQTSAGQLMRYQDMFVNDGGIGFDQMRDLKAMKVEVDQVGKGAAYTFQLGKKTYAYAFKQDGQGTERSFIELAPPLTQDPAIRQKLGPKMVKHMEAPESKYTYSEVLGTPQPRVSLKLERKPGDPDKPYTTVTFNNAFLFDGTTTPQRAEHDYFYDMMGREIRPFWDFLDDEVNKHVGSAKS